MRNGASLFLELQVGLNVIEDKKPLLLVELVKVEGTLRIVYLLL